MSWGYLLLAGLLEIIGIIGLKKMAEKSDWLYFLFLVSGFALSLLFLRLAMMDIPLSIAYAIWTGIGTSGATIIGIIFHKESKNPWRVICIAGIICSIVGLRLIA